MPTQVTAWFAYSVALGPALVIHPRTRPQGSGVHRLRTTVVARCMYLLTIAHYEKAFDK
jgi:hypothetical protein